MSSLECSVCAELFDPIKHQPLILSCSHGLCLQCITRLKPKDEQSANYNVKCPECRQITSRNVVILNRPLLDIIASSIAGEPADSEAHCNPCNSDDVVSIPTTHCFQCQHWLCSYHAQTHTRKHKSHNEVHSYQAVLADPSLRSRVDQQVRAVLKPCLTHTTFTLGQHCIDCDKLVCEQCVDSSHATHRCEHINTALSSLVTSSTSLIEQVAQIDSNVSLPLTVMTQQQQAIESQQDVLNAMSMKIAQLSNQLSAHKLRLDNDKKLMPTSHAKMSSASQQLKADLATRDYNKIKASVNQLQSYYDSCSRLITSRQPSGHISDADMLSSLLEANALLSACDRLVVPSFEDAHEHRDHSLDAPQQLNPQIVDSDVVSLALLNIDSVCVRLSEISRSAVLSVSDHDRQLLIGSMLSWTTPQLLDIATRLQHNISLQSGLCKLIVSQLDRAVQSTPQFVSACDLISRFCAWLEYQQWFANTVSQIKPALERRMSDASAEISAAAFLAKCAVFGPASSETHRLYALDQMKVRYLKVNEGVELIPRLSAFPYLKHLSLRKSGLVDSCRVLNRVLASVPFLTSLDIGDNQIGAAGCQSLSSNLASVSLLTSLDISSNQISDTGCQSLSRNLASVPLLTSLKIGYNHIGAAGCQSLSSNLASVPLLTRFDIRYNLISDAGCQSLSSNLASVPLLTSLDISDNQIGAAGCQSLSRNLASVPLLTSLNIYKNQIGASQLQSLKRTGSSWLRMDV